MLINPLDIFFRNPIPPQQLRLIMPEGEIYHAKLRHSGMKNEEDMTVLVVWEEASGK